MTETINQMRPMDEREAFIEQIVGMTGVGKTYASLHEIMSHVQAVPEIGKKARRGYIFDTNMEPQYAENFPDTVTLENIHTVPRGKIARVLPMLPDGSMMTDEDKRQAASYLAEKATYCVLVFDDIDNYYRGSKGREISKLFSSYRHRSTDVMITHQSLSPIQTVEWQNSHYVRLHKTTDKVSRIASRVANPELFEIAELIVDEQFKMAENHYANGNLTLPQFKERRSFFVWVDIRGNKIRGGFRIRGFMRAVEKYLSINRKIVSNTIKQTKAKSGSKLTEAEAMQQLITDYTLLYYDGSEKLGI